MKDNTLLILGLVAATGAAIYFAMRGNNGGKASGPQSPAWGSSGKGGSEAGNFITRGSVAQSQNSAPENQVITPTTTPEQAIIIKQAARVATTTSSPSVSEPQPVSDATTQPVVVAPTGKKLAVQGLFGTYI